ncbi:MAG: hypothetical protein KC912_05030 [Proteobacteria bacterium]|nr:hypothetical protein [Pseudomonadota bacterium]
MIVIGAGRVGTALAEASRAAGIDCTLISRESGWEALDETGAMPIVLCVRNDDLADVIPRIPASRYRDLVVIQNGAVSDWIQNQGLGELTRGLLYLAVAKRGDPIQPGSTPSPFSGRHAGTMKVWFDAMKLPAVEVNWPSFLVEEGVKLGWLLAHGVLCELYDMDVGTIAEERHGELTSLSQEICKVWRAAKGVDIDVGWFVRRLEDYSRSIPTYRASVKEWPWRNGWMVETARRRRVSTPVHDHLLEQIGHGDKLG